MTKSTLAIAVVVALCLQVPTARAQGWSTGSLFGGTSSSAEMDENSDPFLAAASMSGPVVNPAPTEEQTWVTLDRSSLLNVDHSESEADSDADVGRATFNTVRDPELQDVGYSTLDLFPQEYPPEPPETPIPQQEQSLLDLIMKPGVDFRWEPKDRGFGVLEFWGGFQVPFVPAMELFGSPPPMVAVNAGYTDLQGVDEFYTFSIGLNWYRPVNDQWAWYLSLKPIIATDLDNTSGDMWRVKANVFAFYNCSPELQWSFGVMVTGRTDIPILPAVGVVWYPNERTKLDLTFPRPRIYHILTGDAEREMWVYVGGELGGGTWADQLPGGFEDELTYRAYRLAFGLEFVPAGSKRPGGSSSGNSAYIETGLSFGRELELERLGATAELDDVFYLGGGMRF